jgi:pimeloyl-ACP methyl ester carboxylesterase
VLFDVYVSNQQVQGLPLEDLAVPTLVVNAEDDPLSAFGNARRAVERMPSAGLLAIPTGGHLVLGSEDHVRDRIRHHIATT